MTRQKISTRFIQFAVDPIHSKRIPATGPLIVVSNHLDSDYQKGLKAFFENYGFEAMLLLPPMPKDEYWLKTCKDRIGTLQDWEAIIIFTSLGIGSRRSIRRTARVNKLLRYLPRSGIPVLPVFLTTCAQEQCGIRIGRPITPEQQLAFGKRKRFTKFLRAKICSLGSVLDVEPYFFPEKRPGNGQSPLAPPIPTEIIDSEINSLPDRYRIASQGKFDVFISEAGDIPECHKEIGRLRELTFRMAGEGTGNARDIDEFDLYYKQLIIWDREAKQIVGGYRMGPGDKICCEIGVEGMYVNSLFKMKRGFQAILRNSVELGRSYIIPEYQRSRLPLFLLWKGILQFLTDNPQYRYLYGPLSISKYYSNVSRSLIVAFVKKHYYDHRMARYIRPRKPFKARLEDIDLDALLLNTNGELSELDSFIEDIEPVHFRVPVLLRQYIRQNARFIGFNLDPNFSDVLDGLMLLDLRNLPHQTLQVLKRAPA